MKIKVGFCYNLYKDFPKKDWQPEDIAAEWTDDADVKTIRTGLLQAGFDVIDIGSPQKLLDENVRKQVDIVFSIAEMLGYRYRESVASIICELFELPYTFSRPDDLVIAIDKHISNLIVKDLGVQVPQWYLIKKENDLKGLTLTDFPYIIKPVAEGSSIGISNDSVTFTYQETLEKAKEILLKYKQPILIQKFIQGQEVTVGVLEDNSKIIALKPVEVMDLVNGQNKVNDVQNKMKAKESNIIKTVKNKDLEIQIQNTAIIIFEAFDCKDTARVDFRLDNKGNLFFLEINPLTDYTPRKDFCKSAAAFGINYPTLLQKIILNAWNNRESRLQK